MVTFIKDMSEAPMCKDHGPCQVASWEGPKNLSTYVNMLRDLLRLPKKVCGYCSWPLSLLEHRAWSYPSKVVGVSCALQICSRRNA